MTPSRGIGADELLRRFDAFGGRVWHFKGHRVCYVSTLPRGPFRLLHSRTGFGRWILPPLTECAELVTKRESMQANRILLDRAKRQPPIVPTLAGLEEHLQHIHVHTLTSRDAIWSAINQWCRLVEVCETAESADAFRHRSVPSINDVFTRVAARALL
jgi:hypothetical protein